MTQHGLGGGGLLLFCLFVFVGDMGCCYLFFSFSLFWEGGVGVILAFFPPSLLRFKLFVWNGWWKTRIARNRELVF